MTRQEYYALNHIGGLPSEVHYMVIGAVVEYPPNFANNSTMAPIFHFTSKRRACLI
jgi:hypothetical protein